MNQSNNNNNHNKNKRPDRGGMKRPIKGFRKMVSKPFIKEIAKEPTSGGIVYRHNDKDELEFLLIQDAKDRWTIPKGHIEPGERARETCEREVREETGLQEMKVQDWLGKINFQYRRENRLVLMTQQIYLVKALGDSDKLMAEDWMNGIGWHKSADALAMVEYEDITKHMLIALRKIREKGNK